MIWGACESAEFWMLLFLLIADKKNIYILWQPVSNSHANKRRSLFLDLNSW